MPLSIYKLNNLLGEKTRWEEEFWPPTPEHVKEKQNQIKVIYYNYTNFTILFQLSPVCLNPMNTSVIQFTVKFIGSEVKGDSGQTGSWSSSNE